MNKNKGLLINGFSLKNSDEFDDLEKYPFSIPVIKNFKKITFKKPVTFIIGENGSGKSTLIEAFAKYCWFNAEGGSRNIHFSTRDTTSKFHEYLHAEVSTDFRRFDGYFLRSETLYNLASEIEKRSERILLNPHLWIRLMHTGIIMKMSSVITVIFPCINNPMVKACCRS
jgi:predicted ATPase